MCRSSGVIARGVAWLLRLIPEPSTRWTLPGSPPMEAMNSSMARVPALQLPSPQRLAPSTLDSVSA